MSVTTLHGKTSHFTNAAIIRQHLEEFINEIKIRKEQKKEVRDENAKQTVTR
jgi:hypothetical protein